jgi:hypothetical protein
MFYFGKKGYETPATGVSTQYEDELQSIPERKQVSNLLLRKSLEVSKKGFVSPLASKALSPSKKTKRGTAHPKNPMRKSEIKGCGAEAKAKKEKQKPRERKTTIGYVKHTKKQNKKN